MDIKKHITALGFVPKNGTNGIYHKIYVDYAIEIDFEKVLTMVVVLLPIVRLLKIFLMRKIL